MKKGINQWTFPHNITLKEMFALTKKYNFSGIELALDLEGEITPKSTATELKKIRTEAESFGLEIASLGSTLTWRYPLTSNDPKTVEFSKEIVREGLRIASELGADTFLVIPGVVQVPWVKDCEVVPYDVVYERAQKALKELAPVAEKYKVYIGLENIWNKFLLSPLEFKRFIEEIGCEYVAMYLDTGNVLPTGHPEQWIRILGNLIKKVHIKDFRATGDMAGGGTFVLPLEGNVNWKEVMKAFREINYTGYLIAEYYAYPMHPESSLANLSTNLDAILTL